jgi:N-acetylneuraminic acid mutarotase
MTDTWTATSTTNAPTARVGHSAVWTGSEMIVWGGVDKGGFPNMTNTGGRYNPSTDTWTATSTANTPTARDTHTAVWTGTEMIIWGGYDGDDVNTGGKYNPVTDSWTATTLINAPAVRDTHTAVWTGTEMIVWGGTNGVAELLGSGGRYSPSN